MPDDRKQILSPFTGRKKQKAWVVKVMIVIMMMKIVISVFKIIKL